MRIYVIITNFANPDMVGHTGVIPAAIKAIEAVDERVGKVVAAVKETGAKALHLRRPTEMQSR